jgi:hypothetical protein
MKVWYPGGLLAVALMAAVLPVSAQAHAHDATAGAQTKPLSARARAEIAELEAAVAALKTPELARAAGFQPVLGLIPTMGVHWVNPQRVRDGSRFDLTKPDHLMFAPVQGEPRLVGVAYAYRGPPGEVRPAAFDGELDQWHEHPFLAPAGQTLTMLHVWFVASPDGEFAGHNPFLPYWAVGLEPPPAARMADAADARRIRTLALALSETVDSVNLVQLSRARTSLAQSLEPHRAAIRALVPELAEAGRRGDVIAWNAAADRANAQWQQIREIYLRSIPAARRQRLREFFDEIIAGGHSGH